MGDARHHIIPLFLLVYNIKKWTGKELVCLPCKLNKIRYSQFSINIVFSVFSVHFQAV